jgi:hypothetical protein
VLVLLLFVAVFIITTASFNRFFRRTRHLCRLLRREKYKEEGG